MKPISLCLKVTLWIFAAVALGLLSGCRKSEIVPPLLIATEVVQLPPGMSETEAATLISLEQIDDYPLYTMQYLAEYDQELVLDAAVETHNLSAPIWSCALFAALGNTEEMNFGRNFDWEFSPALLLFTNPADGYAAVSMVDIAYLGYSDESAFGLTELPLSELTELLIAYLPFDGMNEAGLAVGMAAVSPGGMVADPEKETVGSLLVIRKMLDQAATVEEALIILKSYNIDFVDGPPLHYLIADKSGRSALVEFFQGEVKVIPNSDLWQAATNFLISETFSDPKSQCGRYALISDKLEESEGQLTSQESMSLLKNVAQANTQWSVVYGFSTGQIQLVMDREYRNVYSFQLEDTKD